MGLAHWDYKLENILIEVEKFQPIVADFGYAGPMEEECIKGTPGYMAPEVYSSQVGGKQDLFSIGVIALGLLYSGIPFSPNDDKKSPLSYWNLAKERNWEKFWSQLENASSP